MSKMMKIILLHQGHIQHYRVSIYNYLSKYLEKNNYYLKVVSNGVQEENPYKIIFPLITFRLSLRNLISHLRDEQPFAVIYFINPGNLYLFPLIMFMKAAGIKVIYWGHGFDLQDTKSKIKTLLNKFLHKISDALILYSEDLKYRIALSCHKKVFIANNTLNFEGLELSIDFNRKQFLQKEGIRTLRNIVFSGRVQKRKRIEDLLAAFKLIDCDDIGLIIIGPLDKEYAYIAELKENNIYYIGPCYGKRTLQFLKASDVFCIPGALGLSIVDAQYCGLPIVTEDVQHGPEIMYLKGNINGFKVPYGDVILLSEKIKLLLNNIDLNVQFSKAAFSEYQLNGHIDRLCEGFLECLKFL